MKWTYKHELKAFLIYRIVKKKLDNDNPFPENKFSSLMDKLKNIHDLYNPGKGKKNASKKTKIIFNTYKNMPIEDIKELLYKKQQVWIN